MCVLCTNLDKMLKCDPLVEFVRFLHMKKGSYRQTMNQKAQSQFPSLAFALRFKCCPVGVVCPISFGGLGGSGHPALQMALQMECFQIQTLNGGAEENSSLANCVKCFFLYF